MAMSKCIARPDVRVRSGSSVVVVPGRQADWKTGREAECHVTGGGKKAKEAPR
jgi:hypothetical protein